MNFRLLLLCAGALGLGAQPPADFEASVKAAMAPSIAQQRAAIRKQAGNLAAAPAVSPAAFFTTPFTLAAAAGSAECDPLPAKQLDAIVQGEAQKTGVDARLVRAVIEQESGGRPCALSAKGAEGLMQLMPATSEEYDVEDPFDPQQNVEAGTKLLRSLLERYGNDPALALGAYNAGAGRVDQAGGVPRIPETTDYVTAILEKLATLAAGGHSGASDKGSPAVSATQNSGWQTQSLSIKDF